MNFRKSIIYKKKEMRLGQALRRFSNLTREEDFNGLSLEVDALEELSLSAFSMMKAIKKALVEDAEEKAKAIITTLPRKSCACTPSLCGGHRCGCYCHKEIERDMYGCIIQPKDQLGRIIRPFSTSE